MGGGQLKQLKDCIWPAVLLVLDLVFDDEWAAIDDADTTRENPAPYLEHRGTVPLGSLLQHPQGRSNSKESDERNR